jgi:hypothetical protein
VKISHYTVESCGANTDHTIHFYAGVHISPHGGGVLVAISNLILHKSVLTSTSAAFSLELIALEPLLKDPLIVYGVYMPLMPWSSMSFPFPPGEVVCESAFNLNLIQVWRNQPTFMAIF